MYNKPTFQDVLLSFSYRYGESAIPAAGIDNRKSWINDGVQFIAERIGIRKSVAVTVINGVVSLNASTTEPAPDFKSFWSLRDSNGLPYEIVNQEDYPSRTGRVCSITGNFGTGQTLNVKDDGDYTLWYIYHIEPMVSLTDICAVPDKEAVAAYAYSKIRMSETDPLEDAEDAMNECLDRIVKMTEDAAGNEGDLSFKPLF